MAKAKTKTKTKAKTTSESNGNNQGQQLIIHTQYIKDFSFENPGAPKALMENGAQPEIEIHVHVTANPLNEKRLFEVVLAIRATASRDGDNIFIAELSYAAILTVSESVDEKALHPIVMIEGPRLIFPFARALMSETTQAGGFMPLNIQPVDFIRIYQQGIQAQKDKA